MGATMSRRRADANRKAKAAVITEAQKEALFQAELARLTPETPPEEPPGQLDLNPPADDNEKTPPVQKPKPIQGKPNGSHGSSKNKNT